MSCADRRGGGRMGVGTIKTKDWSKPFVGVDSTSTSTASPPPTPTGAPGFSPTGRQSRQCRTPSDRRGRQGDQPPLVGFMQKAASGVVCKKNADCNKPHAHRGRCLVRPAVQVTVPIKPENMTFAGDLKVCAPEDVVIGQFQCFLRAEPVLHDYQDPFPVVGNLPDDELCHIPGLCLYESSNDSDQHFMAKAIDQFLHDYQDQFQIAQHRAESAVLPPPETAVVVYAADRPTRTSCPRKIHNAERPGSCVDIPKRASESATPQVFAPDRESRSSSTAKRDRAKQALKHQHPPAVSETSSYKKAKTVVHSSGRALWTCGQYQWAADTQQGPSPFGLYYSFATRE
jgi:hypothetical protein